MREASTDAGATSRALWRAALGLLCLDAAFAFLVTLAAHPPPRVPEVRFALRADPLPQPPRPAPAPVVVAYAVTVPIRTTPPPVVDLSALTDGAAPPVHGGQARSRVDALGPATPTARPLDAPTAPRTASRADRIEPARATLAALGDPGRTLQPRADGLIPDAPPLPFEIAVAATGRSETDRLLALADAALLDEPSRVDRATRLAAADRLTPIVSASAPRDETAWRAAARPRSNEPLAPELQPTTRPSPAVLLARWLPELDAARPAAGLKSEFVRLVLPLVMRVNEEVLRYRERAVALAPEADSGHELSDVDTHAAAELLRVARLDGWDTEELLLRLDAVPLSMALAQAAQESGWGRSRPAREDNALFGQTEFVRGGLSRVQSFGDLIETVYAYARNLNTHRAYAEFRRRRAALRARGDMLDGHTLVAFIQRYSERGPRYIEAVRQVMRFNNLSLLDATALDGALGEAAPVLGPALDGAALEQILATDPFAPDSGLPEPKSQGTDN